MKNSPCWADCPAVPAADAPSAPDHYRFGLDHVKDEARTDRDASLTPNAIFCDYDRRIQLAFHHSNASVFQKISPRRMSRVKSNSFNHATFDHFGQLTGPHQRKGKGSAPKKLKGKEDEIPEWFCP
jgi:hypothetical protein